MCRVHTRCRNSKGTELKRRVILIAGLLAIGLVFAGCTKSEKPDETKTSPTKPATAIEISDAWARESTAMADAGAVYMNIKNDGTTDDKLLSASVSPDVAGVVEIHETVKVTTPTATATGSSGGNMGGNMGALRLSTQSAAENDHSKSEMAPSPNAEMKKESGGEHSGGMMKMQKVEYIAIPAGKTTKLEPGGYHVMLMKLAKPLKVGETITVSLTFEKAGKKEVTATVKEA